MGNEFYLETEKLIIKSFNRTTIKKACSVYLQCEDFMQNDGEISSTINQLESNFNQITFDGGHFCGIYNQYDNLIGIVDFIPGNYDGLPQNAFISKVLICKEYRNQGYGREVIQLIEDELARNHKITTFLTSIELKNKAILFWKKLGYYIYSAPEIHVNSSWIYHLKKEVIA